MFAFLLLVAVPEPAPVPTFKVENKMPAFSVVNKMPAADPAPIREYWGGSWGWMERGPDGIYRQVSGPGGAAPQTFRSAGYHAGHSCPQCGRNQFVVDGFNSDGTHNHRCAYDGTVWRH